MVIHMFTGRLDVWERWLTDIVQEDNDDQQHIVYQNLPFLKTFFSPISNYKRIDRTLNYFSINNDLLTAPPIIFLGCIFVFVGYG